MLRKPPLSFPLEFPSNRFPPSIHFTVSRPRWFSVIRVQTRDRTWKKKEESKRKVRREKKREWGRECEELRELREDRKIGNNSGSIFDRSLKKVRSVYYAWNLILELWRFAIAKNEERNIGWKSRENERENGERKKIYFNSNTNPRDVFRSLSLSLSLSTRFVFYIYLSRLFRSYMSKSL